MNAETKKVEILENDMISGTTNEIQISSTKLQVNDVNYSADVRFFFFFFNYLSSCLLLFNNLIHKIDRRNF